MRERLRVLIVDDSPPDAELAIQALRKAGYEPIARRVETEAAYMAALDETPDLILCDHKMPQFDSVRAFNVLRERRLEVAFILLSGAISDELAAVAVLRGADAYVSKERMETLAAAVYRTLRRRRRQG